MPHGLFLCLTRFVWEERAGQTRLGRMEGGRRQGWGGTVQCPAGQRSLAWSDEDSWNCSVDRGEDRQQFFLPIVLNSED